MSSQLILCSLKKVPFSFLHPTFSNTCFPYIYITSFLMYFMSLRCKFLLQQLPARVVSCLALQVQPRMRHKMKLLTKFSFIKYVMLHSRKIIQNWLILQYFCANWIFLSMIMMIMMAL